MSFKRQATTDINHENWDQDDPSEHEEMGVFKTATDEELEKRVMRTAKRRIQVSKDEVSQPKTNIFGGFSGFKKTTPASFDFLANLTNGAKPPNTSSSEGNESSKSLFSTQSAATNPRSNMMPINSVNSQEKPTFGNTFSTQSLSNSSKINSMIFTNKSVKIDESPSLKESPFKMPSSLNPIHNPASTALGITSKPFALSQKENKSLFSNNTFKTDINNSNNSSSSPSKSEESNDKLKYYAKLKGLNESVSDWIKKHVEETPLCILTPIFKDYEKYLKEIKGEYEDKKTEITNTKDAETIQKTSLTPVESQQSSLFSSQNKIEPIVTKAPFAFGAISSSPTPATNTNFSFGISSAKNSSNTNTVFTDNNVNANFSFGNGTPFSFSSNTQKPVEQSTETNEDDEPPKVEFTPIVEENSVFDKRCKVFIKKNDSFIDRGVGTLYIKKIEDSEKYQLLVRANTNLGTVLLNFILSSSIPTQRMGKNNVMMVCIPTPDTKPPPTPVLIRVKTSEEADALLETLNKYKA